MIAAVAILLVGACGTDGGRSATATPGASTTASATASATRPAIRVEPSGTPAPQPVRLQLGWARQAQFAGYLAAIDQGYYEAVGIELTIIEGGPGIDAREVGSAPGGPEFIVSPAPAVLVARAAAASDLVNIAQIVRRSGTLSISHTDIGVTGPANFVGLEVGVLPFANDLEVAAGTIRAGLVPGTDYTTVIQGLTMDPFVRGDLAVAQATIYDGYAQVLEATKPDGGAPYQPTDFNVINWNDEGTAMLGDAVFARASWLNEDDHEALARDFLKASFQGWIHCREDPADCVRYTVASGAAAGVVLGPGHQTWMLNEINGLIWPSPNGIGVMDSGLWQQTVDVLVGAALIPAAPPVEAFRTDLAEVALAGFVDIDTIGASFTKGTAEITPGGQ